MLRKGMVAIIAAGSLVGAGLSAGASSASASEPITVRHAIYSTGTNLATDEPVIQNVHWRGGWGYGYGGYRGYGWGGGWGGYRPYYGGWGGPYYSAYPVYPAPVIAYPAYGYPAPYGYGYRGRCW